MITYLFTDYNFSNLQYKNYAMLIITPFCMKLGAVLSGLLEHNIILNLNITILDNIFTILLLYILIDNIVQYYIKSNKLRFLANSLCKFLIKFTFFGQLVVLYELGKFFMNPELILYITNPIPFPLENLKEPDNERSGPNNVHNRTILNNNATDVNNIKADIESDLASFWRKHNRYSELKSAAGSSTPNLNDTKIELLTLQGRIIGKTATLESFLTERERIINHLTS